LIEFIPKNKKEEEIKNKLLNDRINEQLVRKFLSSLLERNGFWVKSPVNVWTLIERYEKPLEC